MRQEVQLWRRGCLVRKEMTRLYIHQNEAVFDKRANKHHERGYYRTEKGMCSGNISMGNMI